MDIAKEVERQYEILTYGVAEIIPAQELKDMIANSLQTGVPLRVKCGIDPTKPDVHLGHLIPYRKMRQFQDLGHQGVVIIGDYTAQIGDPSGKDASRAQLSEEEVTRNADLYMEQVYTVLDRSKTEIRRQSEWFNSVSLKDILHWAHETTVAKLFSHDTFKRRLEQGLPLGLHEFFYPVLQGMDSVYVKADVELGGSDQKFNILMGRDYLKGRGMRPQVAMVLPIVLGLCGKQKMSKSLGNYIAVKDEPFDKFGKVMSIPDELITEYYRYMAWSSEEEIARIGSGLKAGTLHPNEMKKQLASLVVAQFHGEEIGKKMREQFEAVFAKGQIPEDTLTVRYRVGVSILDFLIEHALQASKGEARRLVTQGGLSLVDGEKISDANMTMDESLNGKVLKIGKRKFVRLEVGLF